VAFFAMTDSGDYTEFTTTNKPWSQATGYEPVVAPYGLATGGTITPAAAAGNNNVDVAALTAYMAGVSGASATTGILSVAATTNIAASRGSSTDTHRITSITITSAGAVAAVAGVATTAFSSTRGANGGPPAIPLGSIEIGQVKFTATAAAVVTASEIVQVVGTSQERYDYPVWAVDYLAGTVTFAEALPVIHGTAATAATATKLVYARCATPVFAPIASVRDWVPAETSYSVNSESYYDGVVGSASSSLSQASFTAALNDGVTDNILAKLGENLIFRFKPSRSGSAYQLTQGILGVARTFGVKSASQASFTVTPSQETANFAS
jgi:hypothetical protein